MAAHTEQRTVQKRVFEHSSVNVRTEERMLKDDKKNEEKKTLKEDAISYSATKFS
jgi:hypothetical protein